MEQKINNMLSDLNVFYHKLQCYHWYVKGPDFFTVHGKLEECYDEVQAQIDELAEVALMSGCSPESRLMEYLKNTSFNEAKPEYVSSKAIFKVLLTDYNHLLESIKSLKKMADEKSNYLLSVTCDDFIASYEKKIWMISQSQM